MNNEKIIHITAKFANFIYLSLLISWYLDMNLMPRSYLVICPNPNLV